MINRAAITAWRDEVPWRYNEQVEQDLIVCRALVAIFGDEFLASQLAFRGGTALHKLYLQPQPRYSEDIDLVQIKAGPIKPTLARLGEVLSFLGKPYTKQKRYNNTILFRVESEIPPVMQIRLKVEINCVEHFDVMGLVKVPFSVSNLWFTGDCNITTYRIEELLGTKLRALYQRKKGRDLFDLARGINSGVDAEAVLECYRRYMAFSVETPPSRKQFLANMEEKMADPDFLGDIRELIRPEEQYDHTAAYEHIREVLLEKI